MTSGILLLSVLLGRPATVLSVTRPGISPAAPVVTSEPIQIVPTPKPIESARPYQRYEGTLSDLEVGLFDDAIDSKWDSHTLLEAALIAGGVGDARQMAESQERFRRFAERAGGAFDASAPPDVVVRKLFDFMHREILVGGYELECTDLAATLERGQFNCVSSTVLFNCLVAQFGLEPIGMELPGHAMSRLHLGEENLDVETTCPAWFRMQNDPERRAVLVARTIGADPYGANASQGREVSAVELVAMIYYNRGVDLLMAKRFSEAAAANAKALRLDPSSQTARGNLLATLNNWAITAGATSSYEMAIDLLQQGMNLDPAYETFTANYVHLYHQWSQSLCAQGDFETALEILRQANSGLVGSQRLGQLRLEVYRRWAQRMFELGKSREALQLLRTAESECRPLATLSHQVKTEAASARSGGRSSSTSRAATPKP